MPLCMKFLRISYIWNHIVFVCLLSFNIIFLRLIYFVECFHISFLFYSWIVCSKYGYITIWFSIHQLTDLWLISSSWLLWIMLALSIHIQVLHVDMFSFLLGKYVGLGLLSCLVKCIFNLITYCPTVLQVAAPFCVPISGTWLWQLLHILPDTWYCWCF